jgi:F0F1-type ATP synthase membrane subunit b/b'
VKREAQAQTALRKVNADLEAARKNLSDTGRAAAKIISDAKADADHIRAQAHDEAEDFLKNVRSAVTAAASVIKRHKQEND